MAEQNIRFPSSPGTVAGFKTGRGYPIEFAHPGSIYSYDAANGQSIRYKAAGGDEGLKALHFVGFVGKELRSFISQTIYNPPREPSYGMPFYGALTNRNFDLNQLKPAPGALASIPDGTYLKAVYTLPAPGDKKLHLIVPVLRKNPNGTTVREENGSFAIDTYRTLGRVETLPRAGVHPYEVRIDAESYLCAQLGNAVTEVFQSRRELQAAIQNAEYPVHVGEDGQLRNGKQQQRVPSRAARTVGYVSRAVARHAL